MERNGWSLFQHALFADQLRSLTKAVEELAESDPEGFQTHPKAKLLNTIRKFILETIPANPNAPEFRQGNTLGEDNRHWFRAKFHERFRLFFRFSSKERVIIYVWVNDEASLRKRGASTDVYEVFRRMLGSGYPPKSLDDLKKQASAIPEEAQPTAASFRKKPRPSRTELALARQALVFPVRSGGTKVKAEPPFLTYFPNIFAASMAMNFPRERARTSPPRVRISAWLICTRPRRLRWRPSATRGLPSGTGLRYSTFISRVSATTCRNLFALPMASSRMVAMMPPWACPGGPR